MTDKENGSTKVSGERGIAAGGNVTDSTLISGTVYIFNNIKISKRVLKRFSIVVIVAILVFILINIFTLVGCPPQEGYTFESNSLNGWQIRYDGETRMGESLDIASKIPCAFDINAALAFKFQLGNYGVAQIGLEGKNISLTDEMSAWVFVPEDGSDTLVAQCFVLEDAQSNWRWYDTAPDNLIMGQWTKITCMLGDFRPDSGWDNPPLMIGLQFYDTEKKEYLATVYIDSITIR